MKTAWGMKFVMLFLFPLWLAAHPHIFVDIFFDLKIEEQKLTSVDVHWVLDEMTSMTLLMDYDSDKDGKFNPAETATVKEEGFDHLSEYSYYTHFMIQGKETAIPTPQNFHLTVENNRVVYHFELPYAIPVEPNMQLQLTCYDPENYMGMILDSERNRIHGLEKRPVHTRVDFLDLENLVADALVVEIAS